MALGLLAALGDAEAEVAVLGAALAAVLGTSLAAVLAEVAVDALEHAKSERVRIKTRMIAITFFMYIPS